MPEVLKGKNVAFLATDGVEQIELDRPWQALLDAGASVTLVSPAEGEIQGFNHLDRGEKRAVDVSADTANPADYDALVVPGGVVNSDLLRVDADCVAFTRAFFDRGKPVASICHAPWILVEADVVAGRKLTSWPSLRTDLRNAGALWVDEEVVVDQGLVTSRKPDDLDAFCARTIGVIAEGSRRRQAESA